MNVQLAIEAGRGSRQVSLGAYLQPSDEEQALGEAHAWIKALRLVEVDGSPLRRRFAVRDDSLWWFAELYLHKQQVVLQVCRLLRALEHLRARERPSALRMAAGGRVARAVVRAFASAYGLGADAALPRDHVALRIARMDLRARGLRLAALGSRVKAGAAGTARRARVAAFVHRAFWRTGGRQGDAESYIGPVLEVLERRLSAGEVRYIGVGPPANFRARRWWHPLRRPAEQVEPIEGLAPLAALRDSAQLWRERHHMRRALEASPGIRDHAVIRGCDCWPVVREELAGIALLQWPWSARAMDEAAAALEALEPDVVLTYAEAGGWGRALMLEARRRGIPSAGLQHGFIYRHWLNYLHEADEMRPDPARPADRGFPRPDLTLLFDAFAADHLVQAGRFPSGALAVTGSPRLDALVEATRRLSPEDLERARRDAGADPGRVLVLLVTKYKEARDVLPALVEAAGGRADTHLAIKSHPAETADVYGALAAGRPGVRVLPPDAPLAPLLAAARAVVTVNSTVALDAAVLGVPALVIGLPNNLSPFVEAGVMGGVRGSEAIGPALGRILYDDEFRQQLDRDRRAFLKRFAIRADGRAAERSADAILALAEGSRGPSRPPQAPVPD